MAGEELCCCLVIAYFSVTPLIPESPEVFSRVVCIEK